MAQWQRKLLLNPEWDQAQDHKISHHELALSIAAKLRALKPFKAELDNINEEREELAETFESLAEDPEATQGNFNYEMEALYSWGDQRLDGDWNGKKVCWIDHMTTVEAPAEVQS
jgi:hypothetical protein